MYHKVVKFLYLLIYTEKLEITSYIEFTCFLPPLEYILSVLLLVFRIRRAMHDITKVHVCMMQFLTSKTLIAWNLKKGLVPKYDIQGETIV